MMDVSGAALIGLWATGLWSALGSPATVSALTISGYATTPNTLGQLNTYIGTCYCGTGYTGYGTYDYDITPCISPQELAIIGGMYAVGYWNNLAQLTMGAGGYGVGGLPVQSLGDGDTKIAYQNAAAIGQVYMGWADKALLQLNYNVGVYLNQVLGANVPRSIAFGNSFYPGWSFSFNGLGP